MMYSPAMMSMQSPASMPGMPPGYPSMATTQQDLIARAMPRPMTMPQMPQFGAQQMAMALPTPMPATMPTPMLRATPGATGRFADPGMEASYRMLGRTAGYLDPSRAGAYADQMWGQKAEQTGQNIGAAASMIPGVGMMAGIGMSMAGGPLFNNPMTRAMFGPSERAAQHMSMMANIQHRTFGNMQLTGGDTGLGGAGVSMPGAMQLGQQYTATAERWGRVRGAGEQDVGKYKQDLVRMTEMASQGGLLDASTNIDQISDTVMKLMKVMGRMAKLTGDPDFRNNLKEIAQLRTMGMSIDQAVETTRNLAFYAKGAGVSQQQLMGQGGMQGAQAWAQAGLASGVGIAHGAASQARAKQFAGVFDPYTEQIMGGREGIQQKLTDMSAQFASGPGMQAMLGAAMTFNAKGELVADSGRIQEMMKGGVNMSQLASSSMQNFHRVVQETSQRLGVSQSEAMSQVLVRQKALLSQLSEDPEKMRMMQLGMYGALRKGGLESTAAAFAVGGSEENAQLIQKMASDPTIRDRMRVQLNERLRVLQSEARKERGAQREQREEMRWDQWEEKLPGVGFIRETRRGMRKWGEASREREAEGLAREQMETQDEEMGTKSAYVGRTNARLVAEFRAQNQRLAKHTGTLIAGAQGMDQYQQARQTLAKGGTDFGGGAWGLVGTSFTGPGSQYRMSTDLLGVAQRAAGERDTWYQGAASAVARGTYGFDRALGALAVPNKWGEMDKPYIKALDDTLSMASAIKQTEKKSTTDLYRTMNQLESDLTKAGGDPTKVRGAMNAMNSEIITELERGFAGGEKGMSRDKLRGIIRDKLIQSKGLTPEQADASLKKYEKEWDQYIIQVGKEGGPGSRAAVAQQEQLGAETVEKLNEGTIDDLNDQIERSKAKWDRELMESGVVAGTEIRGVTFGRGMTAEEKEAMSAFKEMTAGEGGAKRGAAMMLMATKEFGDTKEARDEAMAEVGKLASTEEGLKTIAEVKARMEKLGGGGKEHLGKFQKIGARRGFKMTGEEWKSQIELGKKESGMFASLFGPESAVAKAVDAGAVLEGGALRMGAPATGTYADEVSKIQGQKEGLDQLAKDFPDATKQLSLAADKLDKAADKFASNIEKEMDFLRDKLR
jgi:hypothetical protein